MSKSQTPNVTTPKDEGAETLQNLVGFVQTLIEIDKQQKVPNKKK